MKETVSDGAREVRWGVHSNVRCSILKRAISDFQRRPGWWPGKSDHTWQTCVLTALHRAVDERIMDTSPTGTLRLLDSSPIVWSFCLRDISPTGHFAYWTLRLLDSLPTVWSFRLWTLCLLIGHFAYKIVWHIPVLKLNQAIRLWLQDCIAITYAFNSACLYGNCIKNATCKCSHTSLSTTPTKNFEYYGRRLLLLFIPNFTKIIKL